jgi:multidrug efflux system membrane fusion protein
MWRKLLILPPIIAGIFVVWWFASQRQLPQTLPPAEEVRNVRVIEVAPVDVVPMVSGYGTVQPGKTWKAVVQAAGEIEYVHPDLKRGAILPAGTEIVRISTRDYDLALAEAEANIERAEAQIAELDVSSENLASSLELERQVLGIRERELDRRRKLQASGTASSTALDQETRDTLAQRKKVLDLENNLKLIPSQRSALEQQKKLNELQLDQARLNLERTRITLPFDARIAEVSAEVTQYAQAGSTLATADGIETAEVEAQVPLAQFSALARAAAGNGQTINAGVSPETVSRIIDSLGFKASIRLDAGGRSIVWPARFARVSDTIDLKTRSVGIIVTSEGSWSEAVPGERPPLSKGLFVEVEIRANALADQIVVPRAAVHDGRVYVADKDDRLEIRPVRTGLSQAGLVVVDEGLSAGDRVVVSDLLPAIPGMKLRLTRDEALEASMASRLVPDDTR